MAKVHRRKGSPFWHLEYRVNGRRIRESTGSSSKPWAERLLAKRIQDIATSREFPEEFRRQNSPTVAEMLASRLADRAPVVSSRTLTRYRISEAHLVAALGDQDAKTLARDDIRGYRTARLAAGASPASVNRDIGLLNSAYRQAVADELLTRNPCQGVEMLPEPESSEHVRIFTAAEVEAIMQHADEWFGRFIWICYMTGNRIGELTMVRVVDINLANRLMRFRAENVKGRRGRRESRVIALAPDVIPVLEQQVRHAMLQGSEWLWPQERDPRKPIDPNRPSTLFYKARKAAGISGRCHDLRHTFVTHLVGSGIPTHIISDYIGHADKTMVERVYDHTKPVRLPILDAALEQFGHTMATNLGARISESGT